MRIQTIEHVAFEGPAAIETWAKDRGYNLRRTGIFSGDQFPPVEEVDLIVDMGGPMGVYDEVLYPWLVKEKEYLRRAIDSGCGILGICLGAQLLAEVLGGTVTKNPQREIGWFPVTLTTDGLSAPVCKGLPEQFTAFHWHSDTFSIPSGATCIASSEACAHQGFAVDSRLVGLQFHLETTPDSMECLMANCAAEMYPATHYVQTSEVIRNAIDNTMTMSDTLYTILDNIIKGIKK